MNLLDLIIKMSVDDQASSKVDSIAGKLKSSTKSGSDSAKGSLSSLSDRFKSFGEKAKHDVGVLGQALTKVPGPIGKVAGAVQAVGGKISGFASKAKASIEKISPAAEKVGEKLKGIGAAAGTAVKAMSVAAAGAAVGLGKSALDAYASYEQLEGGISKLFSTNMNRKDFVEQFAGSAEEANKVWADGEKAFSTVMENAQQAYKTTGMSANEYMETVSGFAAALTNSLGGDTVAAAGQADVAMRAISDNVNTFGSDIESVKMAFGGFAKQNYTMLDNLKLGYGGTKEEMQRLIDDANAWGAANGKASNLSMDSFSDVVTAIDQIQEKQKIAGTTANEAGTTIEGSVNAAKAAWTNLLTELGKEDGDIGARMGELFTSIFGDGTDSNLGVMGNVVPAVERIATGAGEALREFAPRIGQALQEYGPSLIASAVNLFTNILVGLAQVLPSLASAVVSALPQIASSIAEGLPQIRSAAIEMWGGLGQALGEVLPMLVDALGYVITHLPEIIVNGVGGMIEAGGAFFGGIIDGFLGKQPEVNQAAGQVTQGATDAAMANADGSPAADQWMDTFNSQFDFSATEQQAAEGAQAATDAAVENADGTPIAEKLNTSSQAGIDTTAMNAPAVEMVNNAVTAAKAIDVSEIGQQFSSSAASGMDTSAISDKMSAITSAAQAASATVKIGVQADTSGITAVTAAAQAIPGAFASASAAASASLGQISTKAAQVAASVRASINAIPSSKTITLSFSKPHIPVPTYSISGSLDPKNKTVPTVSAWWGAEGGILTKATIFGAGEVGPEAVLPLTKLEKMLDESNGKYQGGGDTYNITLYAQPGDSPEQMAMALTNAIETRNRMRGRTTARKAVRSL